MTFILSCGSTFASAAVSTNGPPIPGRFQVTPVNGVELNTIFSLIALVWIDEDLPTTYQFGFISPSTLTSLTLLGRSENTYVSSVMPAGTKELDNNNINCLLQVYDVYNSSTSANSAIIVTPLSNKDSAISTIAALLQNSTDEATVDDIKAILSVASTVLNRVECSTAPNCTTLNRGNCFLTVNTCGGCLTGYQGDNGDKNTFCQSNLNAGIGKGGICSSDGDCSNSILICKNSTCQYNSKKCPLDCAGHGVCTSTYISTRLPILECRIDNLFCETYCICDDGYTIYRYRM